MFSGTNLVDYAGGGGGGGGGFLSPLDMGGGGGGGILSTIGGIGGIGSGILGLLGAGNLMKMGKGADPFGPYREQYAQQLSQLEAHPELLAKTPGYEAGIQAVQRGMAAQGYLGSGNEATALLKYGGDIYSQQVQQLSKLAGADISPSTSADIYKSGLDVASSSLGSLGYGATMLSGWNPALMGRAA